MFARGQLGILHQPGGRFRKPPPVIGYGRYGSICESVTGFQNLPWGLEKGLISKGGLPEIAGKISKVVLPAVNKVISDNNEGNLDISDLTKMIGSGLGDSFLGNAGGLLKGGSGSFFK